MRGKILLFLALLCAAAYVHAQEQAIGSLTVNQDERLDAVLHEEYSRTSLPTDSLEVRIPGYRVQIFSNNNPRKAKTDAFALEEVIKSEYPEYNVYVSYSAPFWKVRMGDFTNYYEALLLARRMMAEKPKMAGDIFVMKEEYVVPIYIDLTPDSVKLSKAAPLGLHEKLSVKSTQPYYYY